MSIRRYYASRIAAVLYGGALLLAVLPAGKSDLAGDSGPCGPAIVTVFGDGGSYCDGQGRGRLGWVVLLTMLAAPAAVIYVASPHQGAGVLSSSAEPQPTTADI